MANLWQEQTNSLPLAGEALIGMLAATAGRHEIPARPWPIVAACEHLAKALPKRSPWRLAAHFSLQMGAEKTVERWLRTLAREGRASTRGRSTEARWVLHLAWVSHWKLVAEGLPADERQQWRHAGQVLKTCLSTWEKSSAAASRGPSPSTSGHRGI
jgi:hypothetical protein